jgi:amidase
MNDVCMAPLTEVATLLRNRQLSSVELTRAILDRIGKLDPGLHSYITVTGEQALAQAAIADQEIAGGRYRGPLHGVPIGIKDLCATAGIRTTCASRVLADWVPDHDATVVGKLAAAGAVMVGKLNLTEFALSGYAEDWPIPINPWSPNHFTGVSSSGSGVATAAGLTFGALGTDTGGSIRFPAACCGVVGLKPTYGRVSRAGVFPLADSLDHVGPLARTVADCAAWLDVMAGHDPNDPTSLQAPAPNCLNALDQRIAGLRIGMDPRYSTSNVAPDMEQALQDFAAVLQQQGAHVVEVRMPAIDDDLLNGWSVLCAGDAAVAHAATYPARAQDYGITFRTFLEYAQSQPAAAYARAHIARLQFRGALRTVFTAVDAVLCPSMPFLPPPAAFLNPYAAFLPAIGSVMRYTAPFDFSGSPTLSVPCGFSSDGLPYSAQLIADHLNEALLCRLGHAYQQATTWHRRIPPVAA